MSGRLIAMRHPPVDAPGLCYGQFEVALKGNPTPRLIELDQSPLLNGIRTIWSSPWSRARIVAEWFALSRNLDIHFDGRISELCFGEWEGRRFEDLERENPASFQHWMENWQTAAPPGGESLDDLLQRVRSWALERREEPHDRLLVTHAGVIRALRVLQNGIDWQTAMNQPVRFLEPEEVDLLVIRP